MRKHSKDVDKCQEVQTELGNNEKNNDKTIGCSCSKQKMNVDEVSKIGNMISQVLTTHKGTKATIKTELQ